MEEIKGDGGSRSGRDSPSSSPPTPPSPLPVSVGPGNQKYFFSPSPSSSPPFSSHASAENLPLLQEKPDEEPAQVRSAFSMDRPEYDRLDNKSSCLKDLLEWFIQRCCNCCSTIGLDSPSMKQASSLSLTPAN